MAVAPEIKYKVYQGTMCYFINCCFWSKHLKICWLHNYPPVFYPNIIQEFSQKLTCILNQMGVLGNSNLFVSVGVAKHQSSLFRHKRQNKLFLLTFLIKFLIKKTLQHFLIMYQLLKKQNYFLIGNVTHFLCQTVTQKHKSHTQTHTHKKCVLYYI